MAQQLVQNGQAFNVLNQYSLNELLNLDPDMAYNALQVMEGSADEGNAIEALEQFSQAQLWQAMLDCMSDVLIQVFSNYPDITNNILVQLCVINRTSMNEIANDMGYNNYYLLTNEQLVELLLSEGRYDELNSLIKTYFSNQQIVLVTGSSSFTLKDFLLNTYGYGGFLEALKCYDNEQLKQFLTTGTLSQSLVKTYLIASVYQQFLLEKLNEQNFVLYLQYVLQQNNINSINYAITNMQTQPVYNYLTWVKQSFGNSAYNSLASNLEFTRTLKLNDWQLYGSSRLGVYNADTTLTNITFTINGIDSNGNFEVNQVISQTSISVNHYDMQHFLAYKQYELTNHLGNVLATVLDRKTKNTADVVTAQHYYPFGSVMSSYKAEEFGYRFGFNGKKKDVEINGDGNSYNYGARLIDPRVGLWISIDPLAAKYPFLSPYVFVINTPLSAYDPDGKRVYFVAGAGNDQDGWNYTDRFKKIFEARGISDFKRVNATHGSAGDITFTALNRSIGWEIQLKFTPGVPSGFTLVIARVQDEQIDAAVAQILDDLARNPLKEGEQLNLTGYSYGSVLQAHVALRLADKGIKVDNLILIGSPISTNSDLFKELSTNKNIGQVIRHDIKNDKLSNPQNLAEFVSGAIESSELGKGDDAPHFDLARPGKVANLKIKSLADVLKEKGVY